MDIVKMYNSGVSVTKIAEQLNISRYKVTTELRKLGVNVYNKQNEINWDIENAINLYHSGKSLSAIAKLCSVSVSVVSIRFKKLGIPVINYQNMVKFDNTIFDVIDNEEKAYWLGFIYADGYIAKNSNNFEIALALKDTDHLQKFANFVKYENNIKTDSYRCRFQVYDKHMKQALINLGVTPIKSLTLTFPNYSQVPKELMCHFIRGYYDGDGCIITKETSQKKILTNILGTDNFLTGILSEINIKVNINKTGSNVKQITFAIENSKIFCEYIYKDSTIFLERKLNLYKNYLKTIK